MSKIVYDKVMCESTTFGTQISCKLDDENVVKPILVAAEDAGAWTELLSDVMDLRDQVATLKIENSRLSAENKIHVDKITELSNENDDLLKNLNSINMSDRIELLKKGLSDLIDNTFSNELSEDVDVTVCDINEPNVRYVVNDDYLINFVRAAKILGYSFQEAEKMLKCDMASVLRRHNFNWARLATSDDIYFVRNIQKEPRFTNTQRTSRALKQNGKKLIKKLETNLKNLGKVNMALETFSKKSGVQVADLWAICVFKGISFTLNGKRTFFRSDIHYVPFLTNMQKIENAGGLEVIKKELEKKNMTQAIIADKLKVSQGSLSELLNLK